jgi:hypothetical protein
MPRTASLSPILRALLTALRRGARTLGSFAGNNLFIAAVGLLFLKDPGGFAAINFLIAVIVFFPLSGDPLRKIPPARLALWPVTRARRAALRFIALWLNPAAWILIGVALWRQASLGLFALIIAMAVAAVATPSLNRGGLPRLPLPLFPAPLNHLLRKNLRQLFSTLDLIAALLIAVPCAIARIAEVLPRDSALVLTICVAIILSSYAQTLYGLDRGGDFTRYHLLPAAPWKILAARDATYLLTGFLLTAALSPLAGLSAFLTALITGRRNSLRRRNDQTRWRFSMSPAFSGGLVQMLAIIFAACATELWSPFVLLLVIAVYAATYRFYSLPAC